jgi:hypothetical protein
MKTDPLAGDITALRGEYSGLYPAPRRLVAYYFRAENGSACSTRRRHCAPDFKNILKA